MTDRRSPFHRGEESVQARLGLGEKMRPVGRRMIRDHMSPEHQEFFAGLPLLMVGTVDTDRRPWASALAGVPGFLQPQDPHTLRVMARAIYGDPLNTALVEGADIGALGLEFHTRRRNRVNGKIERVGRYGFDIHVVQSFGNCPKYIQARDVDTADAIETIGEARPVRRGEALGKDDTALIARSDTFFIASQFSEDRDDWSHGIDVSHRGGLPGFVVVPHETTLLFPDYPGNRMFNTLGNIALNPRCGLLFIDFETGNTLQMTGEAEILWESPHIQRFPGAQRAVSFRVGETLGIERALPIAWTFRDYSPVFEHLRHLPGGS